MALNSLGQTIGGRQAVIKILHPCMEKDNCVVKVPDGAASTSVVMERRDEYEVSAAPSAVTAEANWNCIVASPPFLIGSTVIIRWLATATVAGGEMENVWYLAMTNMGNPASMFPNFASVTGGTSTTVFQYTILGASVLTPNIAYQDESGLSQYVKQIRRTYMGITTDLNASDLYNQGRVVSGQWSPDVSITLDYTNTSPGTPPVVDVYPAYESQTPPLTVENIVQSDEFSREAEAKTGSYMPIRPSAPSWEFTSSTEWRLIITSAPGFPTPGIADGMAKDLWLRGWCVGVEYWAGIDYRSTLRIKRHEGLELVPSSGSPYSPFATPALPDDILAKQIINEFCRKEPHAFPADYNEKDFMLGNIISGIADALEGLGIPIVSPLIGGVRKVIDPLAGLLGNIFGN